MRWLGLIVGAHTSITIVGFDGSGRKKAIYITQTIVQKGGKHQHGEQEQNTMSRKKTVFRFSCFDRAIKYDYENSNQVTHQVTVSFM